MEEKMNKLLKKDYNQFSIDTDYYYKTLIFKFLDIGLFEEKALKKESFSKFFLNLNLDNKDIVHIIELLENDSVLLEMLQLWASEETVTNLKFLENIYLKIPSANILSLKHLFKMI